MRITALTVFMLVFLAAACFAAGPKPLEADSLPQPEGLTGMSVPGVDDAPPSFDPERARLEQYYNQKMLTVEGVITAIDHELRTITIKGSGGESVYAFDENTRFQVRLKPIEPHELRVGSKMAGLYRPNGDMLYISRVVVISSGRRRR